MTILLNKDIIVQSNNPLYFCTKIEDIRTVPLTAHHVKVQTLWMCLISRLRTPRLFQWQTVPDWLYLTSRLGTYGLFNWLHITWLYVPYWLFLTSILRTLRLFDQLYFTDVSYLKIEDIQTVSLAGPLGPVRIRIPLQNSQSIYRSKVSHSLQAGSQ